MDSLMKYIYWAHKSMEIPQHAKADTNNDLPKHQEKDQSMTDGQKCQDTNFQHQKLLKNS